MDRHAHQEIPSTRIHELAGLFPGRQLALVMDSVAAGNTAARAWRLRHEAGDGLALLWDQGNNVFYLSGSPNPVAASFIAGPLRETAVEAGLARFHVHALSASLEKALPLLFAPCRLTRKEKLFYALASPPSSPPALGLEDVEFVPIDRSLLDRSDDGGVEAVRAEIAWMWPTIERFHRYGLGIAAVHRGALACWCTAEYVGPRTCGIGIETVPRLQNLGLATATTLRFVEACARRGLAPCWECDGDNVASRRVAEKAGFVVAERSVRSQARFAPPA